MQSGETDIVCGMYGICIDSDGRNFDYMIVDNYIPWNEVPDGYTTKVIPAGTWAVFPCRGLCLSHYRMSTQGYGPNGCRAVRNIN